MARGGRFRSHRHTGGHHHNYTGGGASGAAVFQILMDALHGSAGRASLVNGVYAFVGNQMNFRAQCDNFPPPIMPTMPIMPQPNLLMQPNIVPMMQQDMMMVQPNVMQHEMMMQNQMHQNITQNMMRQPSIMEPNVMMLQDMSPQSMMGPQQAEMSLLQANLNIVGNKTKPSNTCCYILTTVLGSFFILPLCFMCCMWWKKIVYPLYELSVGAYQSIASLIAKAPNINNLTLTVVDNAFNAQKARILHEAMSRSRITSFTFSNKALPCNCQSSEIDDFRTNMAPIKSMTNVSSSITWGDVIA